MIGLLSRMKLKRKKIKTREKIASLEELREKKVKYQAFDQKREVIEIFWKRIKKRISKNN